MFTVINKCTTHSLLGLFEIQPLIHSQNCTCSFATFSYFLQKLQSSYCNILNLLPLAQTKDVHIDSTQGPKTHFEIMNLKPYGNCYDEKIYSLFFVPYIGQSRKAVTPLATNCFERDASPNLLAQNHIKYLNYKIAMFSWL